MRVLSPSLLSANFYDIQSEMKILTKEGIQNLHIDVMDGFYVPSISFGMPVIASLRQQMKAQNLEMHFDVHMMVKDPDRYIKDMCLAGADHITVHIECTTHLDRCIHQIKELGMTAGVSLNPATPLHSLEEILPELDLVLLMSVNPGFGGQKYIPYITEKIKKLVKIREERNLDFIIQVDGGINMETISTVLEAGVENIVAGSAVFTGNIQENIRNLKKEIARYE